jgi:hypothetical protein
MIRVRTDHSLTFTAIILCGVLALQIPVAIYAQEGSEVEPIWIDLNKPIDGTISQPGESVWYQFNATAGDSYVIEVYNASVSMSPFFTFYSSAGNILSWSAAKIVYNFTETGNYRVEVTHTDSTYGIGTYTIRLRLAEPPSAVVNVFDTISLDPIPNATVRFYHPLTYKLVGENVTDSNGQTKIPLGGHGYYLVTVSADLYDDIYGVTTITGEGPNILWGSLALTQYTGFVLTSALVKGVVVPGEDNLITVSIANENATYPITLTNITVFLPWFGFYDGDIKGLIILDEDMPLIMPPHDDEVFTIRFTAPSDVTAYISSALTANSAVYFSGEAPAWRTTYQVIEGVGLKENRTLINVPLYPDVQATQGFSVPLEGFSSVPVSDLPLAGKLDEVSVDIKDVSDRLGEIDVRIGDLNSEFFTTSSTLKQVLSSLGDLNQNIGEVSSTLNTSDDKLAEISSGLSETNNRLDTVNQAVSDLASQQQDTNTKLDELGQKIATAQQDTGSLVTHLSDDIRTLLLILIVVTAVVAASSVISLVRRSTPNTT